MADNLSPLVNLDLINQIYKTINAQITERVYNPKYNSKATLGSKDNKYVEAYISGNTSTGTLNDLTLAKAAKGFTISGGDTSKTLTVADTSTITGSLTVSAATNIVKSLTVGAAETYTGAVTVRSKGAKPTTITGPNNLEAILIDGTYTTSATTENSTTPTENKLLKIKKVDAKTFLAGPATGTDKAAPDYRTIVASDLPEASASASGIVTAGTQTFAGEKTFSETIKGSINGNAATTDQVKTEKIDTNASYHVSFVKNNNDTATKETVYTSSKLTYNPSTGTLEATKLAGELGASSITGTLGVDHGGTGIASFAAGDILYASGASTLTVLSKGKDDQILKLSDGEPAWGTNNTPTAFTWSDGTTAGPTGSLTGNGMTAVSFAAIPSASASASGVVTTGAQTFAGTKTFNETIKGSINGNAVTATTADKLAHSLSVQDGETTPVKAIDGWNGSADKTLTIKGGTNSPIATAATDGTITITHDKKGPSATTDTSKGDTSAQTPGFGGTFKVTSATVDIYGHTTKLAEHSVTIPSTAASEKASGLVTTENQTFKGTKTFSDTIDGSINGNAATTDQVKTIKTDSNASYHVSFVGGNNASATKETVYTNSKLTYNPNTGTLSATTFSGTASKLAHSLSVQDGASTPVTAVDGWNGSADETLTIKGDSPVATSATANVITITHDKKGPDTTKATSAGDTVHQTPGFGGKFKVTSATVDTYGHTTALAEHTVTIPSTGASEKVSGLVTTEDQTFAGVKTFSNETNSNAEFTKGAVIVKGGLSVVKDIYANAVHNAVWNDLVDCMEVPEDTDLEFGYCYSWNRDRVEKTSRKSKNCIGIHSNTAGLFMGEKPTKTIQAAVAGFALAYTDKIYPEGTPLTWSDDGKLTKCTVLKRVLHPERVIATFYKEESEEKWHNLPVSGRHWVKIA